MRTQLTVKGMHCSSCAMNIEDALLDTPGITNAEVSLRAETVVVDHDDSVDAGALRRAIVDAGYETVQ